MDWKTIDWTNPDATISRYFTVREALWLPAWKVLHIPSDAEKAAIVEHAARMDLVRSFVSAPVRVHCWIRPAALNNPASVHHGQDYNAAIGGAPKSEHRLGSATDYDVLGMECDEVRAALEPKLEEFGLRMERRPGSDWVHNDSGPVPSGGNRFFWP